MERLYSPKEVTRMFNEYSKIKYMCKCGHVVVIPKWLNKKLCNWCGCYVFKNKKDEFEFRMNEQIKRRKNYEN